MARTRTTSRTSTGGKGKRQPLAPQNPMQIKYDCGCGAIGSVTVLVKEDDDVFTIVAKACRQMEADIEEAFFKLEGEAGEPDRVVTSLWANGKRGRNTALVKGTSTRVGLLTFGEAAPLSRGAAKKARME